MKKLISVKAFELPKNGLPYTVMFSVFEEKTKNSSSFENHIGTAERAVDATSLTHASLIGVHGAVMKFANNNWHSGTVYIDNEEAFKWLNGFFGIAKGEIEELIKAINYWSMRFKTILKYGDETAETTFDAEFAKKELERVKKWASFSEAETKHLIVDGKNQI